MIASFVVAIVVLLVVMRATAILDRFASALEGSRAKDVAKNAERAAQAKASDAAEHEARARRSKNRAAVDAANRGFVVFSPSGDTRPRSYDVEDVDEPNWPDPFRSSELWQHAERTAGRRRKDL